MKIVIIAVGEVDAALLEELSSSLGKIFGYTINIHQKIALPSHYYDKRRKQFDVSGFLASLKKIPIKKSEKLLAITEADLFAEGLNFIFGQAEMGGSISIISLARLRQEFYGAPADSRLLMERAVKETVHELGHNLGLSHCPDIKCVMHFSNSLHDTDIKSNAFCPHCQPKLLK